ncbi:lipid-binding SYLF domain-containing protein [Candidatus Parabeggiatoa sp. HSG14]|uniref:lipid-binding SYLF domain-containing protein n=1 Tax=Candidatus Parabeggiatoa sp. HSG14 TaxID=3055593 RepID=UPI0025A71569|nr:lipid-binding SYLF domain-containing protein [Thiotrichales bacterium HSG14]
MGILTKYVSAFFIVLSMVSGPVYAFGDDEDEFFVEEIPTPKQLNGQISAFTTGLETILKKIPKELMQKAQALAVINTKKGGFIFAIEAGTGVMSVNNGEDWSNLAFVTSSAASVGFQAGIEAKTLVLVFTDRNDAEKILKGNLKLGVGLDIVAGPLATDVGTNMVFDKGVYSYSDGMGLFAGLSLKGSSISLDPLPNQGLYGKKNLTASQIFYGNLNSSASKANNLRDVLRAATEK